MKILSVVAVFSTLAPFGEVASTRHEEDIVAEASQVAQKAVDLLAKARAEHDASIYHQASLWANLAYQQLSVIKGSSDIRELREYASLVGVQALDEAFRDQVLVGSAHVCLGLEISSRDPAVGGTVSYLSGFAVVCSHLDSLERESLVRQDVRSRRFADTMASVSTFNESLSYTENSTRRAQFDFLVADAAYRVIALAAADHHILAPEDLCSALHMLVLRPDGRKSLGPLWGRMKGILDACTDYRSARLRSRHDISSAHAAATRAIGAAIAQVVVLRETGASRGTLEDGILQLAVGFLCDLIVFSLELEGSSSASVCKARATIKEFRVSHAYGVEIRSRIDRVMKSTEGCDVSRPSPPSEVSEVDSSSERSGSGERVSIPGSWVVRVSGALSTALRVQDDATHYAAGAAGEGAIQLGRRSSFGRGKNYKVELGGRYGASVMRLRVVDGWSSEVQYPIAGEVVLLQSLSVYTRHGFAVHPVHFSIHAEVGAGLQVLLQGTNFGAIEVAPGGYLCSFYDSVCVGGRYFVGLHRRERAFDFASGVGVLLSIELVNFVLGTRK